MSENVKEKLTNSLEVSDEFPSKQDQPKSDPPDNPKKGIIYYLLHGLIFQFN